MEQLEHEPVPIWDPDKCKARIYTLGCYTSLRFLFKDEILKVSLDKIIPETKSRYPCSLTTGFFVTPH